VAPAIWKLEFKMDVVAGCHERLVREDIRDTTRLRELALLEQMIVMLPARVAQPFSLNALREDLGVSHDSVTLWTKTLEEFYYLFLIPAYSRKLPRASKKERKLYLWDYSELRSPGEKFENMIASHLLKWSHSAGDLGYTEIDLRFIKNKEKKEVDFLILRDRKPVLLIEAKYADPTPTAASIELSAQLGGIPIIHVVDGDDTLSHKTIREGQHKISWTLTSAAGLCQHLP
jgi:predicted AAA+ superfamily ATPase